MFHRVVSALGLLVIVSAPVGAVTPAAVSTTYGMLPLRFESNRGQADSRARFIARGAGYTLFLTRDEALLRLRDSGGEDADSVIAMRLVGASAREPVGEDPQAGRSSYLHGNDRSRWRRDVPAWSRVAYANVYRGIDLVYHGRQRQLEYDFVVAPGANPRRIEMAFRGADRLSVDGEGNLVLGDAGRRVMLLKPVLYQDVDGRRQTVEGAYVLRDDRVRFRIGKYDRTRTLVIDPVLVYSTFLGGNTGDAGWGIAVDGSGSAYVVGHTGSADFPLHNPMKASISSNNWEVFVAKLSPAGDSLVYSTYLGGTNEDFGFGIAIDATGNAYVTGTTTSPDFPLVGAVQGIGGNGDAFVAKLNATGTDLLYSTVLGGTQREEGRGIAVDANGRAVVIGTTASGSSSQNPDQRPFPTVNAFQSALNGSYGVNQDLFLAKLSPAGGALVFSTYFGGSGSEPDADLCRAVAVDATGDIWITAETHSTNFPTASPMQSSSGGAGDAVVARFSGSGALEYSTYLGGSETDGGRAIAVDGNGNAYVTGYTASRNFPIANAYKATSDATASFGDAFVTKLNAAGTALVYSTYLGGSWGDAGYGIAVDANGEAYVAGTGSGTSFPDVDPLPDHGTTGSVFLTRFNAAGSVLYSTHIGGGSEFCFGVALDPDRNAYITGYTGASSYPVTAGAFQRSIGGGQDAFVSKISPILGTVTTVSSSSNPSALGAAVTFTATVTGAGATGTVQFKDGSTNLGSPQLLSGGSAIALADALAAGPHTITAAYGGDAEFLSSTSAPLVQTVLPPFGAPPGFSATASSGTAVSLSWIAVADAHQYEVARRSRVDGTYAVIVTVTGTTSTDSGVETGKSYLYNVRAVAASGVRSSWSATDPATTVMFTDPATVNGLHVKAVHLTQLRTAVNAMRTAANLPPLTFTDPSAGASTTIRAVHVQELRDGLHAARGALGLAAASYTDTLHATQTAIRAVHVEELRDRTR